MANNEMKTNAEIYREQRKERLAKAAKKKSHSKRDKIIGIIVKVVCILVALGFVLTFTANALTKVFYVPQKVLTAATYGDQKITVAEYNYYYMSLYNQACSLSQQYDSQYSGYGSSYFNTKVSPAEQDYTGEDAPEGVKTWADYFAHMAVERGFLMKTLYEDAMNDKNFKLTEEQQKDLDTALDDLKKQLEDNAEQNDVSPNVYVSKVCGEGLTLDQYLELSKQDQIAQFYIEWYQENSANDISDKDVAKYYEENKADLAIASIRYFAVMYKSDSNTTAKYSEADAKARAEEFAGKITDEESFKALAIEYAEKEHKDSYKQDSATLGDNLTKSGLTQISEEFANWTFDDARKYGDVKVFNVKSQSAYYIAYIVSGADKDTTVASADVRHLLVQAETKTADGKELSESQVNKNFADAKAEAEALLKEWKEGKATEDSFAALVKEHTDDAGSKDSGGLYEGISNNGQYVQEFTDWALADHKVGDTGLVKTTYGYHIMYYVSNDGIEKWESDTRSAIANERYTEYFDGVYEDIEANAKRSNEKILDFFSGRNLEKIENIVRQNTYTY